MLRCSNCKRPVAPRAENPFFPFCGQRCLTIDLGRWFDGDYRVPGRPEETEDAPPDPRSDEQDGESS